MAVARSDADAAVIGVAAADHAWAAGVFCGEGYSCGGPKSNVKLGVANTNRELLERFYQIVKAGKISEKRDYSGLGKKGKLEWRCSMRADVYLVMNRLWDWLTEEKRQQFREVIARAPEMFIETICQNCGEIFYYKTGKGGSGRGGKPAQTCSLNCNRELANRKRRKAHAAY